MDDNFVVAGDVELPNTLTDITVLCAESIGMNGAAITLSSRENVTGDIAGSASVYLALQEAQSLVGEGPAVDARLHNSTVVVEDFCSASSRWPIFAPIALEAETQSALALPLVAGSVRLGALVFYNAAATQYGETVVARASTVAENATDILLALTLDPSRSLAATVEGVNGSATIVHQATGIIAAQLDCSIDQALVRLRAHAFASGQDATEVARAVVYRKLRFK